MAYLKDTTITGNLTVSGNINNNNIVTSVNGSTGAVTVNGNTITHYSVTFSSSDWSSSGGVYSQTKTVSGYTYDASILKEVQADIDMSTASSSDGSALLTAWGLVGRLYLDGDGLHAVCYDSAPTTNFTVRLTVITG